MTTPIGCEDSAVPPVLLRSYPVPGVLLLQLNRPDKLNALDRRLLGALHDILAWAERDAGVRCVVLTGSGRAFCAGADIDEMAERGIAAYEDAQRLAAQDALAAFPKPLIAAVNGFALGGGLELAMLCDFMIVADTARLGLPEINLAALPGDGGTQRLPRFVGKSVAMRMILTGDAIDAREAHRCGLASEVVAPGELLGRAIAIAAAIAGKSSAAARLAKQAVQMAFEAPLSAGLAFERRATAAVFATPERADAMREHAAKRAAKLNPTNPDKR
jgi:enoyl-CoA hydratase